MVLINPRHTSVLVPLPFYKGVGLTSPPPHSPPLPYHILKGFYPLQIVCYVVYKMMEIL